MRPTTSYCPYRYLIQLTCVTFGYWDRHRCLRAAHRFKHGDCFCISAMRAQLLLNEAPSSLSQDVSTHRACVTQCDLAQGVFAFCTYYSQAWALSAGGACGAIVNAAFARDVQASVYQPQHKQANAAALQNVRSFEVVEPDVTAHRVRGSRTWLPAPLPCMQA